MSKLAFTLKELVAAIAPSSDAETEGRIARQVRHWTAMDLLTPIDGKNTGTGVSRKYDIDEIRKAAILLEYGRYRVPIPVLHESFSDFSEHWTDAPAWTEAISGRHSVYLYTAYSENFIFCQIARRDAVISLLDPKPGTGVHPELQPISAIVINLTRLFARLNL